MRPFRMQRGEGQLGCIFALILLLIAIFFAYKIIPVKVKAAEVRGVVVNEAKNAGQRSDERITRAILAEAEQNGLPVTKESISIHRTSTTVRIEVQYVVPIEFPGYTHQWNFNHVAENPIF